jgi:hypothetical protein
MKEVVVVLPERNVKRMFKKSPEELQLYMYFKKRSFVIKNKRGKGSYNRKSKHAGRFEND